MGRPKGKVDTEEVKLAADPTTIKILDSLIEYGRFGTTRSEIVMFIIRSWFWENETRLKTAIASKDRPLGSASGPPE
jgi:hypothetical protein